MKLNQDLQHIDKINQSIHEYIIHEKSLAHLIRDIEALLDIIGDQHLKEYIFDERLALEEIYASTRTDGFDFSEDGQSVINRAVEELTRKIKLYYIS